ncbi:permease for cytosine/purines, uracil, thiamine, allantoin-domain-containing protein [Russula earlei]|uniref:Permease for cytosine/purines, uracil, thiamine, allantoin-domain-containing protein n=1 Tax=Russula earlei TaxID=71964 RepID=A0ACC0UF92_9AGAM|nr:permease for cytosine/purines, uracil, thiamine, allantoin-domain-containing protein [Russula earlei]
MDDPANARFSMNLKTWDGKIWLDSSVGVTQSAADPTASESMTNKKYGFLAEKLLTWGVEARGILPVAVKDRTETHFIKLFFVWFSANTNILSFSAGTLGPVVYGLGLRESCLVILFFNLLVAIAPAYFSTWGPKLGLRQLCASRYTFGYYGVMVPCMLTIMGEVGFCVLNNVLGGQALASIANISWTIGIIIISLISLFVSFCGLKVLNWYQNCAWVPVVLVFIVATGVSSKDFVDRPAAPATVAQILNFGATVTGFIAAWSAISSDYTVYFHPRVSSWRIFIYTYLGISLPTITLQCLGAAAAISALSVPGWKAGYADGNVGGLVYAMLSPVGKFGKVLMVFLSLSVTANNALGTYSMGMALQTLIPPLVVVPRYVFSVISTALIILLSIVGQHKFYATLSNFLGIIGCWAGAWIAAGCVEHLYFRKGDFSLYDIQYWNVPSNLPLGVAALGASVLGFALVIPSMSQVWFTGPIARKTGDIGFEVAFVVTALLYIPLRSLEKRWRGI